MKKIALIIAICTSIFFACNKEDKTVEPTPVTPTNPTCTTCPYCVKDTVLADTLIHMKVTIDDTISFTASSLFDTVFYSGPQTYVEITGKNSFVSGFPEIKIHLSQANYIDGIIGDTTYTSYITYKTGNTTFQSKKGLLKLKDFVMQGNGISTPYYLQKYSSTFCFNTDTINGKSHKIKLGSVKIKHP
jgi:hypothetical protein